MAPKKEEPKAEETTVEETATEVKLKPGQTVVDQKVLTSILEKQALMEKELEDTKAKAAGMEEIFASQASAAEPKVRKKANYEPAFRTVRIRKYPIKGDRENLGYVIGWTDRGAYRRVVDTGVRKEEVDYLDIIFLGHERNDEGKLQAEAIPLLDLMNNSTPVVCKILETHKSVREVPTGEQIAVQTWDPRHGGTPVATGETIDGFVQFTDIEYDIEIPGVGHPVRIDSKFVN